MAMLSIRQISKRFGAHNALRDASLDLGSGEFFSILGPSGCGKSTLLRILGGFEAPDSGSICLDGKDITRLLPSERPTNMVFQRYALFPHLSVAENVGFSLSLQKKVTASDRRRRIDEALALVAMDGLGERSVQSLSGGQQQRVALARAIICRPRVLLLDEPLSALDLQLRLRMQVELRALQRRLGMTFVFVTHDQGEALSMSDRMAVINGGHIEQVGTPSALYDRPATDFVASFLGTMNRVPVQFHAPCEHSANHVWVELTGGQRLRARWSEGTTMPPSGALVSMLVRPEKMGIREDCHGSTPRMTEAGDELTLSCRVADMAFHGATTQITGQLHDVDISVTATHLNRDGLPVGLGQGSRVRLVVKTEHILIAPDNARN